MKSAIRIISGESKDQHSHKDNQPYRLIIIRVIRAISVRLPIQIPRFIISTDFLDFRDNQPYRLIISVFWLPLKRRFPILPFLLSLRDFKNLQDL